MRPEDEPAARRAKEDALKQLARESRDEIIGVTQSLRIFIDAPKRSRPGVSERDLFAAREALRKAAERLERVVEKIGEAVEPENPLDEIGNLAPPPSAPTKRMITLDE